MPVETLIPDNTPVDIDTAAAMLGVGVRFMRRLCQERRVRYLRMGGNKVRFLPSDLHDFMAASAIEPGGRASVEQARPARLTAQAAFSRLALSS